MSGLAPTSPAAPAAAPLVLILGATGSAGHAAAGAFLANGWRVRAMHRTLDQPACGLEWVWGDAMAPEAVARAAEGARVILHAVNPPKYRNWRGIGIPMLANSIAAAKSSGARLIFPGNIYNFPPDAGVPVDERAPQSPVSRKGKVRVEMEQMLAQAAQHGARSLVIRAGDFFGPGAATSWLHAAMVKPGKPLKSITYPGTPSVGHLWAFLPDFAEAIVRLAAAERGLPAFDVFHFGGHWIDPGIEMARAAARVVGQPDLPIRPMPWPLLRLVSPFSGFMRELLDVEYLWRVPIRLDNRKLTALIGAEPHTPLDEAVRRSLFPAANTAIRS
nr:NAD-dependent epimerase/dehydratase family protein [uncultured Rhodopila sp.]